MKSLQESLFDQDLVKKDVSIDFETLRDMLFDFGRKNEKLFDKTGVWYHEGRQSIYIKKYFGKNDRACFELELGVTNAHKESFITKNGIKTGGMRLTAEFNTPRLYTHDRFAGNHTRNSWNSSYTDINATRRVINNKLGLEDDRNNSVIEATEETIPKIFKLYEGMIKEFCSKEFEKKLRDLVDRYDERKEIPGFLLDILMKQLITKA